MMPGDVCVTALAEKLAIDFVMEHAAKSIDRTPCTSPPCRGPCIRPLVELQSAPAGRTTRLIGLIAHRACAPGGE